jgi:hypothetical protein
MPTWRDVYLESLLRAPIDRPHRHSVCRGRLDMSPTAAHGTSHAIGSPVPELQVKALLVLAAIERLPIPVI